MRDFKYNQVYQMVVKDIESGFLKQHAKIPSVRKMAEQLQMSKTTVENAYAQLLAEGYIYAKKNRGYFVDVAITKTMDVQVLEEAFEAKKEYRYDFSGQAVDHESFNFDIWGKYIKRALQHKQELMRYGNPFGEEQLKQALQKYAMEYRGVRRPSSHYIIGAGFQTLLYHICGLFDKNSVVAIEEGGFKQAEEVFKNCHMQIRKVPVDQEGISVTALENMKVDVVYVNSSSGGYHGHPIKQNRRNALLAYAKKHKVYLIEDDHNGELKFNTKPMEAMAKYDTMYSIYIGSFSKLLLPSIRISYMALPQSLLTRYQEVFQSFHQTASKLEQIALAEYIEDGQLARHLRKLRKHYATKGNYLLSLLQAYFPTTTFILYETPLKITMSLEPGKVEAYLQKAKQHDILINKNSNNELAFSFSGILQEDMEPAIQILQKIWITT